MFLVTQDLALDHFDGDLAIGKGIHRQINDTCGPFPEFLGDLVFPDLLDHVRAGIGSKLSYGGNLQYFNRLNMPQCRAGNVQRRYTLCTLVVGPFHAWVEAN